MTREEKCELAIEKGYTYNPKNGLVYNKKGKTIIRKNENGYIFIGIENSKIGFINLKAHQFAWYWVNKKCVECIDHINGIKNDNRICNLRVLTHQKNLWNTKAKGYSWSKKNKKWYAKIGYNYKCISLGYFNTEQEARNAYLEAKQKYHVI
jgi:hypothetical protein